MKSPDAARSNRNLLTYGMLLIALLSLVVCESTQAGVILLKDSADFAYKYEMDVLPSSQDLDSAGSATDWFAGTVSGLTIPPVSGGIGSSSQSAGEVLYRTDFGGSIQRQSLVGGDFTLEAAVRFLGPVDAGDVGGFGFALDPGGASSSFRLNVNTSEVSLDPDGNSAVATGANGDVMHTYRIAYDLSEDRYWAWRDDVLVYGGDLATGIVGTNSPFNNNGSFFLGDFTGSLSGEWEVDHIRLDPEASAPVPEPTAGLLAMLCGLVLLRVYLR